jgi:hypothetical protein
MATPDPAASFSPYVAPDAGFNLSWADNLTWLNGSDVDNDVKEAASITQVVLVSIVVTVLAMVTAGGNLLVMISFKMDKQLQSVSNYFLLSLSVADFAIGLFSMPLYTVYLLMNQWPLGAIMCDLWLAMDYTMSNASVANLIVISVDRYLSVTRPLTYRAKRTPKRAAIMITFAWVISAVLWTPWIVAWPAIEGERTVPDDDCYVQFLLTNPYITIVTAVAAFYFPVIIMCFLYFKIYQETEKRQKDLARLQAGRQPMRPAAETAAQGSKRAGESSDDEASKRRTNDSSPDLDDFEIEFQKHRNSVHLRRTLWMRLRSCCRIDRDVASDFIDDDSSSNEMPGSPGYDHHMHHHAGGSSVKARYHRASTHDSHGMHNGKSSSTPKSPSDTQFMLGVDSSKSTPMLTPSTEMTSASFSRHVSNLSTVTQPPPSYESTQQQLKDSDTYTIVIKLPDSASDSQAKPSIRMISEEDEDDEDEECDERAVLSTSRGDDDAGGEDIPLAVRPSKTSSSSCPTEEDARVPDISVGKSLAESGEAFRVAMQARINARMTDKVREQRARRKRQEKKQEKKAAKTLSAILLAFVITWTPYNVFTIIHTFCPMCINPTLYAIGECVFSAPCAPGFN